MKWFEHQTDDKDQLEARLIRKRFGNEGWGVWQNLMEEIGKNMGNTNVEEWGCVSKEHTMQTLADACYCTLEYFKEFVAYCDDMTILSRKNGRLFSPFVLQRMNEYAARVKTKSERTKETQDTEKPTSNENTEIPYSSETSNTAENIASQHNTTQSQHSTEILNTGEDEARPVKSSIEETLQQKYNFTPPAKNKTGITKSWQDKAFRYADSLKIKLTDEKGLKSRWLKAFKEAETGVNSSNLESAYSYLADYTKPIDNMGKVLLFFQILNNGLSHGGFDNA